MCLISILVTLADSLYLVHVPQVFKSIWIPKRLPLSVLDHDSWRKASCALNYISTFQLHFIQTITRLIKKNEEHLFSFCNLQKLIIYDSFIIFFIIFHDKGRIYIRCVFYIIVDQLFLCLSIPPPSIPMFEL
jgi:hypothetical protein